MESLLAAIGDWLQTWAQPISAIGTVILTVFLVVLYRQQKNLLRDSYHANHRAVVEVEDFHVRDEKLHLTLSNVGNGIATNLELVTTTVFEPSGHLSPGVITDRAMMTEDDIQYGRQSLKPHEDKIRFSARPALGVTYENGHTDRLGIQTAMDELEHADVALLRVNWYLRYTDLRGSYETQYIDGLEVDVDTEIDLLEMMYARGSRMVHGQPTVEPETLELDLSDAVTSDQRTVL